MKYSQIRIALLTFTLGFASVPFSDIVQTKWIESSIELPKAESEILVITAIKRQQIPDGWTGGHGGGGNGGLNPIVPKKKKLKSLYKKLNKSR